MVAVIARNRARDAPKQAVPRLTQPWQSEEARAAFHGGLVRFAALTRDRLQSGDREAAPGLTMFAFAAMVGGFAIARAMRIVDEAASDAVLRDVAAQLQRVMNDGTDPVTPGTATKRPAGKPRSPKAAQGPRSPRSPGAA